MPEPKSKPSALNELLDSTQPMLASDTHAMPASTRCECQDCPEHEDVPCENILAGTGPLDAGIGAGGYLVERAGYSCVDCLPMMIEIGLAMTADAVEPEQNEPTYVRVASFLPNAPTFR